MEKEPLNFKMSYKERKMYGMPASLVIKRGEYCIPHWCDIFREI